MASLTQQPGVWQTAQHPGQNPPPGWVPGTSQKGNPTYYDPRYAVPLLSMQPSQPVNPISPLQKTVAGGPAAILNTIGSYSGPVAGFGQPGSSPGSPLPTQPVYGYDPAYGGVPTVPNPGATGGQSIGGNLGNLGQLGQLSTGVTGINAGIGSLPYQMNLPGYQGLLGQASANTLSNLKGVLPQDVVSQIEQAGAERGVATGSPGSPNANAAMLRALGLTSLGLQQTGASQLGQLIGETPTGPQFNPASMFITPAEQQLAQMMANIFGAAPIPAAAQNAAMNALGRGYNQGRGDTSPTQSLQMASDIAARYNPVQGGTPSPASTPMPQGNWMQQEDGTWVNLDTGEVSWTGPGEQGQGDNYYPGVDQSSSSDTSYADTVYPPDYYGDEG